ncbi:hypothetical protein [Nonomuraea sp. B19D2]|uniref:hypothetical protein n=1 Tax=Nonomuraea sp. B19D2 TaxID=3159561 RepID=UPI0032DBB06C
MLRTIKTAVAAALCRTAFGMGVAGCDGDAMENWDPSPPLVRILRAHLAAFDRGPHGRLFYGVKAGELPFITYRRAWKAARKAALTDKEFTSPLAARPYDLRHACVSMWLNAGVPAPQVAEWAGHSVDVLLRIYAKCIVGQDEAAKRRISAALDE